MLTITIAADQKKKKKNYSITTIFVKSSMVSNDSFVELKLNKLLSKGRSINPTESLRYWNVIRSTDIS